MCYIDPPFFTQKDFGEFIDKWKGRDTYLSWMRKRIFKIHKVLKDTGSIFLHCDHHANYKLRVILDDVFGESNFRNEIIWRYTVGLCSVGKKYFARFNNSIFFYSKSEFSYFKILKEKVDFPKRNPKLKKVDGKLEISRDEKGRPILLELRTHKKMDSVWRIPILNVKTGCSYPTQKPERLLKRIIECSTKEGDLVLDCFGGSGTTAAVAKKLKRNYIIGDKNYKAIDIMKRRLSNDS